MGLLGGRAVTRAEGTAKLGAHVLNGSLTRDEDVDWDALGTTVTELRAWLEKNHPTRGPIWLATSRAESALPCSSVVSNVRARPVGASSSTTAPRNPVAISSVKA